MTAPPALPVRVPDIAPLVAVVERQAEEIARLNRELGAAHERLRLLGSGQMTSQEETPADRASVSWWRRWWERWG